MLSTTDLTFSGGHKPLTVRKALIECALFATDLTCRGQHTRWRFPHSQHVGCFPDSPHSGWFPGNIRVCQCIQEFDTAHRGELTNWRRHHDGEKRDVEFEWLEHR